ncbi:MAG: acyltransferase family protein [Hyphomicrobium sp.]|uniref:acyltransferase family protein n=1 Tax=Hyphomicrobium sp. TaxID=82 RepID=UPI003D147EA0
MPYRPDIDGLRALSIIAVVFYHFGVPAFDGGFVGVDVFFVVSGYLITGIVVSDIRAGRWSFQRFYERRARRLLPTLAIVLAATFAASFVITTPMDLGPVSKSMFYVLIFAANFYFARKGGYFDPSLDLAPLLHTWSLAIEEQFYILWPLLVVLVFLKAPRRLQAVALLLLVASFAANVLTVGEQPTVAFYFPHTRAWELLAGCVLALGAPALGRAAAHVAGIAGLALILFAVFAFDSEMTFPGFAAAIPVLGAALVIWSGQRTTSIAARFLATPPLVFVGLVSYAWYLWHWPMVVLFRYELQREPAGFEIAALVVASFSLAALCWKYVEQPVRFGTWWKPKRRALAAAATVAGAVIAVAAAGAASRGFLAFYPEAMSELTRERLTKRPREMACPPPTAASVAEDDLCLLWTAEDEAQPGMLLWGDSHARSLYTAFHDMAQSANVTLTYISESACPPLIGGGRLHRADATRSCLNLNSAVGDLLRRHKFTDVVLVARWDYYATGNAPLRPTPKQHYLEDAQSAETTLAENRAVIERGLTRAVEAIRASGARAWIVMEAPYVGFNVPQKVAFALMRGRSQDVLYGADSATQRMRATFMQELVGRLGANVIDPARLLCENGHCLAAENGKPLYFDDNHLSVHGAARVRPLLAEMFPRRVHRP